MSKSFLTRLLSATVLIFLTIIFLYSNKIIFNFFIILFFLLSSYEASKLIKKNLLLIVSILFLFFSFYTAYSLMNEYGPNLFLFVLSISVSSDIGGYIFGKILKGPKLISISPKKTVAGAFGSFITSLIISSTLYNILEISSNDQKFHLEIFFLILFLSFVSQTGDIIVSFFKRESNLKDTGKLIPGHGGILDRIDGIIFVFPVYYILMI